MSSPKNNSSEPPNFREWDDETLYQYLIRPDVRKQLVEKANGVPKSELGKEVRRRSKYDLFWLCRYFLWGTMPEGVGRPVEDNWITREVHGRVCDFFIKKDDSKPLSEQDIEFKKRLILYPRGSLKSTIDVCDSVQWILNFPEIRILYYTANVDLAEGFVSETRGHFLWHPEEPTLMNLFFPEFCVTADPVIKKQKAAEKGEAARRNEVGTEYHFTCPVWAAKNIERKEPTLLASSAKSAVSGKHFELVKGDDVVSDTNAENEDQCAKVSKNISKTAKTLRSFGYLDLIGTRYHDADHYGSQLAKYNIGSEIEYEKGPEGVYGPLWELITNHKAGIKILIGRGIVIKPERAAELEKQGIPVTYKNAGEDGVHLLFPQHQSYAWCCKEYADNEEVFEGQINQNPRPPMRVTFDRRLLQTHTTDFTKLPISGLVSQTWDFAFSRKKGRDYTTGCSVIWNDKAQMFVHDLVRERFTPTGLAQAVVNLAVKYRPYVIGIEDAAGSKFLEGSIITEAQKTGIPEVIQVCSKIDWIPVDNQKDAKRIRMEALHPWLMNDNLWFMNYLKDLNVLYEEFERCTFSHHHEDIPDVISRQVKYAPQVLQLIQKNETQTWSRADAQYNLLFEEGCDPFGRVGMGYVPVVDVIQAEPTVGTSVPVPGMPAILGSGIHG